MATPFPLFEGKYEIITKLKEGGMGAVYKVRHRLLDEVRVIKLIRPQLESDEAIRARFLREARTAVRLRHPNIAQFYDFSMDDEGNAFIVMEFIEGITLEELLAKVGTPPLPLALEVAEQSLRPIGYLHRRNTIHRDISPDNLMLSRNDEGFPLVKLIDLGIAKVLEEEGHSQITRRGLTGTGMFLGKVRYASPEQFHAQEGVSMDARSDLYSFGLVLYELLTGMHPIRGSSVPSFIAGHLFHPPVPFVESDPEGRIPEDLRAVVLRALAKSPDARFPSAEAFMQALAPIKARFPLSPEDAAVTLDGITAVFTQKTQVEPLGSTQARLDRQFGIAPTPPPVSTPGGGNLIGTLGTPPVPQPPPSLPPLPPPVPGQEDTSPLSVRAEPAEATPAGPPDAANGVEQTRVLSVPGASAARAAKLVEAARELVEQGRWGEALERLTTASSLDSENAEVRQLRERAEQALAAEAERARRAAALAVHARRVEDLLEAGQLEQARQGLETALSEVGRDEALDALLERLAAAEAAQVRGLCRQAESALAGNAPEEAVAAVQQAIALRPDDEGLRELLHRAEAAVERGRRVRVWLPEIEAALDGNELRTARIALGQAVEEVGADPALVALGERLEALEAAEVEGLRRRAATALDGGDADTAAAAVGEALAFRPDDGDLLALGRRVEELRESERRAAEERRLAEERRAAEERLAAERAAAVAAIRRALGGGDLASAAEAAHQARAGYGEWAELEAAEQELAQAVLRQRFEATSALLVEAERLAGTHEFEAAEARLQEAEVLSPADERVLQALVEVRAAARRFREEQERERAVAADVEAVGRAIEAGALEEAAEQYDALLRKHGERPECAELRRRLREARRAEEARRAAERKAARAARRQEPPGLDEGRTLRIVTEAAAEPPLPEPPPAAPPAPEPPVPQPPRPEPLPPVPPAADLERAPTRPFEMPAAAAAPAQPEAPAVRPARRRWPLWVGLASAVAAAAVLVVAVRKPGPEIAPRPTPAQARATPPPATPAAAAEGILIVTAAPWGEVVSIESEAGASAVTGAPRATPVRLVLPAGRYTVAARDPASGRTVKRSVEVTAGRAVRIVLEVGPVSADELLQRFGWSR
ncbi:MAG TPA: serine/threonine-protein kinase [Thermoanaerobaculaceae bacterium]|nr:serine/threonine-protein kinase [Thermoanaerobaculaceae bacterium]HRS14907.1 serine/threonine-protein kinase [Thermoanaerobaculaceae bacterium]